MASSRQKTIEEAVVTVIQGLSLTGVMSVNVQRLVSSQDVAIEGVQFPAIRVAMTGRETMDPSAGTNQSDELVYPVAVYMLDVANQDQQAKSGGDTWLYWRELIAKAFHNKRLSAVSTSLKCVVQPMEIHSREAWKSNIWLSGLVVNVHCRCGRT